MNGEVGRNWMKAVVAYFNAWLLDISGGTEGNHKEPQSQQASGAEHCTKTELSHNR
jgi:hypothetical protein